MKQKKTVMGRGRTKLKVHWLTHESYKSWIRKASSPYYARCCRCNCDISIENGVEDSLKKHAKTKKAQRTTFSFHK